MELLLLFMIWVKCEVIAGYFTGNCLKAENDVTTPELWIYASLAICLAAPLADVEYAFGFIINYLFGVRLVFSFSLSLTIPYGMLLGITLDVVASLFYPKLLSLFGLNNGW